MKRRFSYSLITQADCMKKIFYYMNRTAVECGPAANRGSLIHKKLEEHITTSPEHHDAEPIDLGWDELEVFSVARNKLDELVFYPGIRLGPEYRIEIDKEGIPYVGIFDLFLNDGTIFDWKFPNKAWDEQKLAKYTKEQAWLYFYLLAKYNPQRMIFYVVNFDDPRAPQEFEVVNNAEIIAQELNSWQNLASAIRAAENMDYWEMSPSPTKCRWCNYRKICEGSMAK